MTTLEYTHLCPEMSQCFSAHVSSHRTRRLAIKPPKDPQPQVRGGFRHIFETADKAVSESGEPDGGYAMTAHHTRELNGRLLANELFEAPRQSQRCCYIILHPDWGNSSGDIMAWVQQHRLRQREASGAGTAPPAFAIQRYFSDGIPFVCYFVIQPLLTVILGILHIVVAIE